MCVFRELSAIGTWTNYAKQMVDQFLNAERERERVGNTRNFDTSVEKSKKFRMSKYFAISGIRNYSVEGKKEKEREEKSNLRE